MGISAGPNSISDSLAFHIDPANPRSYAGVGTVIYDLSGNGKTSYFTNGALYQNYQKGVVLVDGSNDYISTPLFNLTSPVTVSAWVKNIANDAPVFSASGAGVTFGNDEVIHYFSGKSILICGYPAPGKYFQFPQLNFNQWSHLVMTRDASNNMSVYLNGVGSTSNTQSFSNTLQINQIGRYSAFTNIYNAKGSIGEVKIYNRALSASEVLQNYNATKKRYVPEENIVRNGLVLNLDAANPSSYAGSGNTCYDLSGFGNTATLINGTGFGTTGGGMFVFDGADDYIDCGTNSITNLATTTMSAEIMFQTTGATNRPHLFIKGINGSTGQFALVVETTTPPKMKFFLDKGAGWTNITGNATIQNNQWVHAVGVYDGSNAYIYINGSLDVFSSSTGTLRSVPSNSLLIGKFLSDASEFLTGKVSFARLYNRALSATEVMQNFNAMRERYNI